MRQFRRSIANQNTVKVRRKSPIQSRRLVMRIDLMGIRPPIWRRIEANSDLTLDKFHVVIQSAFEWEDSHLHEFVKFGADGRSIVERFLMPYMMEEGEDGTAEESVRLGDVLARPKDTLMYQYDFGDDWEHRIVLEEVKGIEPGVPQVVCTAGKRAAPPDDCGGVWGYQSMIEAWRDPNHPEHEEMAERISWLFGDEEEFDPERFDLEHVNRMLVDLKPAATRW